MIIDSKSNLAKLMASEDINVQQRNVATAYFNLKTRTLVIPKLKKDLSNDVIDLFIGHEVGHALFTPLEGWHDTIVNHGVVQSILNVCEDVRIEKLIRRKFPGLKLSFIKAYRELMGEMDFFGIKQEKIVLQDMNLIDRINIHSKCGSSMGILFTTPERELLKEAENTESWPEVVEVAKKIQKYMEEMAQEEEAETDQQVVETDEEQPGNGIGSKAGDIRSKTDDHFRDFEKRLYDKQDRVEDAYVNIPKVNSDNVIVDYKEFIRLVKRDEEQYNKHMEQTRSELRFIKPNLLKEFKNSTTKVVSYLVKEFELRRNADQLKRASVSKTGDLNMNKIYSYQYMDDIFKRMTVVPKGKSHGLVLFLDWSGSMCGCMNNTIKQLLTLVMFCKKVQIPFEVYAFTDQLEMDNQNRFEYQEGDLMMESMNLLNVLSSRMNSQDFTYAASALLSEIYETPYGITSRDLRLGGTPLNEAIIAAMDLIPKFKSKNRLQIVNAVFLTDGEGHRMTRYKSGSSYTSSYKMVVKDPVTNAHVTVEHSHNCDSSTAFLQLLKQRTDCNVVGFRILSMREVKSFLRNYIEKFGDTDKASHEFSKTGSYITKEFGYDELYLIKDAKLDTDTDSELDINEQQSIRGMVRSFKNYTKGHIGNRVILNNFIKLIS
jgi:hypothetical protein